MNANLEKLINTNDLERQIDALNSQIEFRYRDVRKKEDEVAAYNKDIENLERLTSQMDDLSAKTSEEMKVQDIEMRSIKERIKQSKSEKEIKNLSMDEDVLNEKIAGLKKSLDDLLARKAHYRRKINDLHDKSNSLMDDIKSMSTSVDMEVDELRRHQQEVYNKLSNDILLVDQDVLGFYEKIKKWAGVSSIVPISRGACGGCFMRLGDKVYSEAKSGDNIVNCPHCGRILYVKE